MSLWVDRSSSDINEDLSPKSESLLNNDQSSGISDWEKEATFGRNAEQGAMNSLKTYNTPGKAYT